MHAARMNSTPAPLDLAGDHDPVLAGPFHAWFAPVDPVAVARRHLGVIGMLLVVGLLAALLMRLELLTPAGDHVSATTFGSLFSLHGTLMFYFVLLPAFPGVLGHALLARQAGIKAMAFPRLANTSWHLLALGGACVLLTFVMGGTNAGWSFDAAFGGRFVAPHIATAAFGVFLAAVSASLLGMNIATTIFRWRKNNEPWLSMPPFMTTVFLASLIAIVACPMLAACMAMVIADNLFGFSLFDPTTGADPQLFRSLFWLFGTPALYMVLLPSLGIVTEIFIQRVRPGLVHARFLNPVFAAIAVVAFLLWGQHFQTSAAVRPSTWVAALMTGTMLALVGAVVTTWFVMLLRGLPRMDAALGYAISFIVTVVVGALSGVALALPPVGAFLHGTTFVTAHMHIMMGAALGLAFVGGLHLARPDTAGASMATPPFLLAAGIQLTFLPVLCLGTGGLMRRAYEYPQEFHALQVLATAGMSILLAGIVLAAAALRRRPTASSQAVPLAEATAAR
jgi:cytochrome c oxidase subunit 1